MVKMPVKFKVAALLWLYIELECLRTLRTLLKQHPSDLSALEIPPVFCFRVRKKSIGNLGIEDCESYTAFIFQGLRAVFEKNLIRSLLIDVINNFKQERVS